MTWKSKWQRKAKQIEYDWPIKISTTFLAQKLNPKFLVQKLSTETSKIYHRENYNREIKKLSKKSFKRVSKISSS